MIDTKKQNIIHLSSNDIRKLAVRKLMDSMSNEIANMLFKHNRTDQLFICFYNRKFHIDTKHIHKDRLFTYKMKNPKLTISDSNDDRDMSIELLLIAYFQSFSDDQLVSLFLKVHDLINQVTLKQWLITDYFAIRNYSVRQYIRMHCLNEFATYWLNNFKQLIKYVQKDQQILDEILNLFSDEDFKGELIAKTFIYQLAKLITAVYPDYFCESLISTIINYFNIKNDCQYIVLPFKYLMSYMEGVKYSHYSHVLLTFKLTTTSDLAKLMTFTTPKLSYSSDYKQLKQYNELRFDVGKYQTKISAILSKLESIYHLTGNEDYLQQADLIQTLFKIKKEESKND